MLEGVVVAARPWAWSAVECAVAAFNSSAHALFMS